ncbi:acyl carrier protein phosphodiesterase [Lutibacter sp. TH_r2]|uniref:acyl carrier protein phosphodiesterase n=1 Tax=Lutibacter sp. TH_r2 TaxID=3082083 RepID=UPI002955DAD1|nr:acyl carrier protein phosphodiesterase [Lutibacter sp. TH_r2]MDV7187261.1 acyl carrier protein phosphodiesterase [Lutibacter sp. TH_r2]
MNILAHLYLSKSNKNILIGNFIADAVKGKSYKNYSEEIQIGILLHRYIDSYTDTHPIVKKSMHRLNERYRHYDGVIIDILYDHFLAKNWDAYSNTPLPFYAKETYNFLNENIDIFPERIQKMLPFMIQYNWLEAYRSLEGIERVLIGMNKRTKEKSQMHLAINDLKEHYNEFENDFTTFFKDLILFSEKKTHYLSLQ